MSRSYRGAEHGVPEGVLGRNPHGRPGFRSHGIVDPVEEAVEVWAFGEDGAEHERFTGSLPVRLRGDVAGEIGLTEVFRQVA